jgi:hypothetical protein
MKTLIVFLIVIFNSNFFTQINGFNIKSDSTSRNKIISSNWEIMWDSTIAISYQINSNQVDTIFYDFFEDEAGRHYGYRNFFCDYQDGNWFWYFEGDFTMLSVVGPFISFMYSYDGSGGAHPIVANYYRTYSLIDQSEVLLTDIFSSKDIFRELLKTSLIKEYLKGYNPKDLLDLVKKIDGGCEIDFFNILEQFAIKEIYSSKVLIEFGLPHGCEVGKGTFTNFEITLPIPKNYIKFFEQAKENESYINKMVNDNFYKILSHWYKGTI